MVAFKFSERLINIVWLAETTGGDEVLHFSVAAITIKMFTSYLMSRKRISLVLVIKVKREEGVKCALVKCGKAIKRHRKVVNFFYTCFAANKFKRAIWIFKKPMLGNIH